MSSNSELEYLSIPHFIGIGAMKSGTSWLAAQLRTHPDVYLPPRKELHYFTRGSEYPSPSLFQSDSLVRRILGKTPGDRHWRKESLKFFTNPRNWMSLGQLRWGGHFLLRKTDDDWYRKLFWGANGKVCGEVTPAYSMLNESAVNDICQRFPTSKFILLLRDPVERDWSQCRFHMQTYGKDVSQYSDRELERFLNRDEVQKRSAYTDMLARWESAAGQERVFLGFYEDIADAPQALIDSVCDFLGVAKSDMRPAQLKARINPSKRSDMPESIRHMLIDRYTSMADKLSERFPDEVARWKRNWLK